MDDLSRNTFEGGDLQSWGHVGYVTGRYYPTWRYGTVGGIAGAQGVIYIHPFYLDRALTLTSLSVYTQTGATSSAVKFAIYKNDPLTGRPTGAPIKSETTGIATTVNATAATSTAAGVLGTIGPGWFWFAAKFTGAPTMRSVGATYSMTQLLGGATVLLAGSSLLSGLSITDAYANAWPTNWTGSTVWTEVTALTVPQGILGV